MIVIVIAIVIIVIALLLLVVMCYCYCYFVLLSHTGWPLGFVLCLWAEGPPPSARVRSMADEGGQTEELKKLSTRVPPSTMSY